MIAKPTDLFQIIERDPAPNTSGQFTLASGVLHAWRGQPLGPNLTTAPTDDRLFQAFDLADASKGFFGFLTRDVNLAGPDFTSLYLGTPVTGTNPPTGMEMPFKSGWAVSVEPGRTVEAEGNNYLASGVAYAIVTGTAVGTPLTFTNGLFAIASGTQTPFYTLVANNLVPYVPGNLRIRARRLQG
jgi:hypothetical protein